MKKFISIIALTIALALFATSCSDDDSSTGPSDLKIGEMVATIDGDSWEANFAYYYNNLDAVNGWEVDITNPTSSDRNTIVVDLEVEGEVQEQTYTAFCAYQTSSGMDMNSNDAWQDSEGTCVVTEVSETEIKGTFTFTGINVKDDNDTKEVSGSFYVQRQDNGEI